MAFNWELAETFGFKIISPKQGVGKGNHINCDVYVSINESKGNMRYRFSLSEYAYKKIGANKVKCVVAPSGEKLFFAPDNQGYTISFPSSGKGSRPFFSVAQSSAQSISRFLGRHMLMYSEDLGGYYIDTIQEQEATA